MTMIISKDFILHTEKQELDYKYINTNNAEVKHSKTINHCLVNDSDLNLHILNMFNTNDSSFANSLRK